mgnify:CR=1 FL=1
MTVTMEITAREFVNMCWSGAADTCEDLTFEEIQTVLDILEDSMCDGEMSLTEVNDFFWFERDTIAEWLGYDDYDELMSRDGEEEEE